MATTELSQMKEDHIDATKNNDTDTDNEDNNNNIDDGNDDCPNTSPTTIVPSLFCFVDELPYEVIVIGIVSFLAPKDASNLNVTCMKLSTSAVSLPRITLFEDEKCWLGSRHDDADLPRYSGYIIPVIMKHRIQSITLSCKWNDQGMGNKKGKLYIIGTPMAQDNCNDNDTDTDNDSSTNKEKAEDGNDSDGENDNRMTSDLDVIIDATNNNTSIDLLPKETQERDDDAEIDQYEQIIGLATPKPSQMSLFPVKNCRIAWESSIVAPHQESQLFATFVPRDNEIYHLWYEVGGGGGHELFVKNCHVYTIIHEDENIVHCSNDEQEHRWQTKLSTVAKESKIVINTNEQCKNFIHQSGKGRRNNNSDSIIERRGNISKNYRILQQTTNILQDFNKLIEKIQQSGSNDDNSNSESDSLKNSSSSNDGHFFVELLLNVIQSLLTATTTSTTNNRFTSFLSSYGMICHDRSNLMALEEIVVDYLHSYQSICIYYKENEGIIQDLYRQGLNMDININDIDGNNNGNVNFLAFLENNFAVLLDNNVIEAHLVAPREQERQRRQIRRMDFRFPNTTKCISRLFCCRRRRLGQSVTNNYVNNNRIHSNDQTSPAGGHRRGDGNNYSQEISTRSNSTGTEFENRNRYVSQQQQPDEVEIPRNNGNGSEGHLDDGEDGSSDNIIEAEVIIAVPVARQQGEDNNDRNRLNLIHDGTVRRKRRRFLPSWSRYHRANKSLI